MSYPRALHGSTKYKNPVSICSEKRGFCVPDSWLCLYKFSTLFFQRPLYPKPRKCQGLFARIDRNQPESIVISDSPSGIGSPFHNEYRRPPLPDDAILASQNLPLLHWKLGHKIFRGAIEFSCGGLIQRLGRNAIKVGDIPVDHDLFISEKNNPALDQLDWHRTFVSRHQRIVSYCRFRLSLAKSPLIIFSITSLSLGIWF